MIPIANFGLGTTIPDEITFQISGDTFDPIISTSTILVGNWQVDGESDQNTNNPSFSLTYELKNVTLQLNSFSKIISLTFDNQYIIGNLDLSKLINTTNFVLSTNNELTGLTFPSTTVSITNIQLSGCNLGVLNWEDLSGQTSDNITINMSDNSMIADEVNETLVKLDNNGWGSGTTIIWGNNIEADTNSGGFNGLVAKNNLITKGWTVLSNPLVMLWNVPASSVTIPHLNGYNYDYYIDWGDGSVVEHITTYDEVSHTYSNSGLIEIRIAGICETIYMNNTATEKTYVSSITHWGNTSLKIVNFFGCSNLATLPSGVTEEGKLTEVETFYQSFRNCSSLTTISNGLFSGNTTVTTFASCFNGCTSLITIPSNLFSGCISVITFSDTFRNVPITSISSGLFDDSIDVTNFQSTFYNTNITSIPSGLFDNNTDVNSFQSTFYSTNITSIPSGLFDNNTLVTTFSYTFQLCSSLTAIPTNLFDANTLVEYFQSTFNGGVNITSIPSELFNNNTLVTTFYQTFNNCNIFTTIPIGLFNNNTLVTIFNGTFQNCNALTSLTSELFSGNTAVTTFANCFNSCDDLASIPSDIFTGNTNVISYDNTFNDNSSITSSVPTLWDLVPEPTGTNCYTNCTSASNYGDIPNDWKGF